MNKGLLSVVAIASVALTGLGAVPAAARDYRGGDAYRSDYQDRRDQYQSERQGDYSRDHEPVSQTRYAYQHHRGPYRDAPRERYTDTQGYGDSRPAYREARRCTSGTTGAIVGAVLGGLLGREVGRGGDYNEPSTTGLILGAGGGALAGRAIERTRNCH